MSGSCTTHTSLLAQFSYPMWYDPLATRELFACSPGICPRSCQKIHTAEASPMQSTLDQTYESEVGLSVNLAVRAWLLEFEFHLLRASHEMSCREALATQYLFCNLSAGGSTVEDSAEVFWHTLGWYSGIPDHAQACHHFSALCCPDPCMRQ